MAGILTSSEEAQLLRTWATLDGERCLDDLDLEDGPDFRLGLEMGFARAGNEGYDA